MPERIASLPNFSFEVLEILDQGGKVSDNLFSLSFHEKSW